MVVQLNSKVLYLEQWMLYNLDTYFLNIHWWHFWKGCSAGNIHFFIHFWWLGAKKGGLSSCSDLLYRYCFLT